MITFTELLKRAKKEQIAIHTANEEQAKALLKALDEKGYTWNSGDKLTTMTYYEDEKENTCYVFSRDYLGEKLDKRVIYGSLEFHQENNYTVIKFKDIDFKVEI